MDRNPHPVNHRCRLGPGGAVDDPGVPSVSHRFRLAFSKIAQKDKIMSVEITRRSLVAMGIGAVKSIDHVRKPILAPAIPRSIEEMEFDEM